jgi:hypothetical protein
VHCEVDEALEQAEVAGYNAIAKDFQRSLEAQRELWEMLRGLDRPYLRGTPGIECNAYPELKDYGKLGDLGFQRPAS